MEHSSITTIQRIVCHLPEDYRVQDILDAVEQEIAVDYTDPCQVYNTMRGFSDIDLGKQIRSLCVNYSVYISTDVIEGDCLDIRVKQKSMKNICEAWANITSQPFNHS